MAKKKARPTEKIMTFRWDDDGGAHIHHSPRLTLVDVKMALGALAIIVAHNDYLNGAMPAVNDTLDKIEASIVEYLAAVVMEENQSRILPLKPK